MSGFYYGPDGPAMLGASTREPKPLKLDIKNAIEHVQPSCPDCGFYLPQEAREWAKDCRPHLPWCENCRKPVMALFSRRQEIE